MKQTTDSSAKPSACADSPTGAHHWVLGMPSANVEATCKHCGAEREFHPYEQERRGFNGSVKK